MRLEDAIALVQKRNIRKEQDIIDFLRDNVDCFDYDDQVKIHADPANGRRYLQAPVQTDVGDIHYEVTYQSQGRFPALPSGLYVRLDAEGGIPKALSPILYAIAAQNGFLTDPSNSQGTTRFRHCWSFQEPLDYKNPSEALRGIWDGLRKAVRCV